MLRKNGFIRSSFRSAKQQWKHTLIEHGYCVRPRFLIIGAQKAGTTSLFDYLSHHPSVVPSREKEVCFFSNDEFYQKGEAWYHSHFPMPYRVSKGSLAYEATPEYLFYPQCPERIFRYDAGVKLIIILRDPVERAYSAWNMYRGFQRDPVHFRLAEYRDFETAVREEIQLMNRTPRGDQPLEPSYVRRGLYAEQIERYRAYFPWGQLFIMDMSDLSGDPAGTLDKITDFLGIPRWTWDGAYFAAKNQWKYQSAMPDAVRTMLREFYRPYNRQLAGLLDKEFTWTS